MSGTVKNMIARNKITGLYFTGGGFNGPREEAILLDAPEIALLRAVWDNVWVVRPGEDGW